MDGVLLDLIGAGAFVGLAVVIFPILKRHNETIALGYVVARSFEAVPFIIANISLLSLMTISQEYTQAGASEVSNFLPLGASLRALYDWTQLLGPRILASLAALPFYYLLYQTKLLPRWISIWGLIGSPNVLKLEGLKRPALMGGELLIKVQPASVNPCDWHALAGPKRP